MYKRAFIAGNKLTPILMESIVLMNADITPVYSTMDNDILLYHKALADFDENNNYNSYADYFLDKQLERISEMDIVFNR